MFFDCLKRNSCCFCPQKFQERCDLIFHLSECHEDQVPSDDYVNNYFHNDHCTLGACHKRQSKEEFQSYDSKLFHMLKYHEDTLKQFGYIEGELI